MLSGLFAFGMVCFGGTESRAQVNPIIVISQDPDYNILRGDVGPICAYYRVTDAFGNTITTMPLTGLTSRIVNCILGTVSFATQNYLRKFGDVFIDTINVMAIFSTILLGFYILSGRAQAVGRKSVMLALKIGAVIWMVNFSAFAVLFPSVLFTIEWLVGLVTQYTNVPLGLGGQCPYSPFIWNRIDCMINMLIGGITPGTAISSGIIALASAMLLASNVGVGIFIFLAGIMFGILKAVFHAMFILLSAYIAIALLVVVAPMMIPLILFNATKQYFEKWLRLLIGVMIQPIFLFAFLTIFLIALEVAIFSGPFSVYRSLACNAVNNPNFSIGQYILGSGAIGERSGTSSPFGWDVSQSSKNFKGTAAGTTKMFAGPVGDEAVKTPANTAKPFDSCDETNRASCSSINTNIRVMAAQISVLAANCGMTPVNYFVRLILSLFTAVALIYVFSTMLQFIPYLGTLISSGDLFGLPSLMKELPKDYISSGKIAERAGIIGGGNR